MSDAEGMNERKERHLHDEEESVGEELYECMRIRIHSNRFKEI